MIEVILSQGYIKRFQNDDDLFHFLIESENQDLLNKILERHPDLQNKNWSFTCYSPKRVVALYAYMKKRHAAISEAFIKDLPLIEICTGDFENPVYIPVTPDLDVGSLRKKWCLDYCAFHNFVVRENEKEVERE